MKTLEHENVENQENWWRARKNTIKEKEVTNGGLDEFVLVRRSADRKRDSARRGSTARREGIVGDPLGRQGVELCRRHGHGCLDFRVKRKRKRKWGCIVLCFWCYEIVLWCERLIVVKRWKRKELWFSWRLRGRWCETALQRQYQTWPTTHFFLFFWILAFDTKNNIHSIRKKIIYFVKEFMFNFFHIKWS